jgi:hypothetical protein
MGHVSDIMRMLANLALVTGAYLLLAGCIARTAIDVVTLPVKAAGAAVDATTTSQSEADEKRGREMRKREEQLGKLERQHQKAQQACDAGDNDACREMASLQDQIDATRRADY